MQGIQSHILNNRSLAYSWSHGPHPHPLVVIHGLGDSAIHTYASLFTSTHLRDTPSLFIDLPGFGEGSASLPYSSTIETMADDIADVLSTLRVEKATIFAHSMGANIAIALCTHYPGLARKAILAEPLLRPEDSIIAAGIAKQSQESFVEQGYGKLIRATLLQASRGDKAAEAFLPTLRLANPVSLHRAATSLLRHREPSFVDMLAKLRSRSALLIGERTEADFTGPKLEGIPVVRVAGAGHFMMVESSHAAASAILKLTYTAREGSTVD